MYSSALLSISGIFKASPVEEAGERFVYLEASNEALDQQNEIVLAKALADSADFFLKYGNLDIDHITQIGLKHHIPDYPLYEIGKPVDVRVADKRCWVKGQIYQGEGPVAAKANLFWDSLTRLTPPSRWYASVAGSQPVRREVLDPETKTRRTYVEKVLWTNVGFSKTPVNTNVPVVSTLPIGALAKCWTPYGFDLSKAGMDAGYGTDAALLQDGGALRNQSLDHQLQSYFEFRDRLSADLTGQPLTHPTPAALAQWCRDHYGLDEPTAAKWVRRFMGDVRNHVKRTSHHELQSTH